MPHPSRKFCSGLMLGLSWGWSVLVVWWSVYLSIHKSDGWQLLDGAPDLIEAASAHLLQHLSIIPPLLQLSLALQTASHTTQSCHSV